MKNKFRLIMICLLVLLVAFASFGCANNDEATDNDQDVVCAEPDDGDGVVVDRYGAVGALSDDELTLEKMMTYALQDEYLARNEYLYILDEFGDITPFNNIVQSEETHIAMLLDLYDAHDMDVPEDKSDYYIIYPLDVKEALETGVQAEIDNIAMYEKFLEEELPDDVRAGFVALRDASISHLDAFQTRLDRY